MAEINAAYDALRGAGPPDPPARAQDTSRPDPPDRALRRRLGPELAGALLADEQVLVTAQASTWDAHEVRLVVTDRRLLWLRDDAISDRVRSLPWTRVRTVDGEVRRRLRRTGELRVVTDLGRRLAFGELEPGRLPQLLAAIGPLVRA